MTSAHTLLYASAAWMVLCAGFTDNSTAGDTSHIVPCRISKTSLSTCAVFKCPWFAGLKMQSSWWMSAYFRTPCTLSQQDAVLLHHYHTPPSTSSKIQMWTCSTYNNCVTPCSVLHHKVSNVITTAHQLIPPSSINDRLSYNLSPVTFTTVSTSHHKTKGLSNTIIVMGT